MAMNYCDYYMNTLSVYISTKVLSPLDFYYPSSKSFYIWYPGVENRTVALFLQSNSRKAYPTIESRVYYSGHTSLSFIFYTVFNENRTVPIGYKFEVNL